MERCRCARNALGTCIRIGRLIRLFAAVNYEYTRRIALAESAQGARRRLITAVQLSHRCVMTLTNVNTSARSRKNARGESPRSVIDFFGQQSAAAELSKQDDFRAECRKSAGAARRTIDYRHATWNSASAKRGLKHKQSCSIAMFRKFLSALYSPLSWKIMELFRCGTTRKNIFDSMFRA